MKKIISIITCLVLLLSLTLCISATLTPAVTCKSSADKVKIGETITITVTLKDTQKITALAVTPEYDETAFELVSGEWLIKDPFISDFNGVDGVAAYTEDTYCNTDIFKFVLRAKSIPVFADAKISVKTKFQNSDYNGDIAHDVISCSVTVVSDVQETTPPAKETTPAKPPVQQTTPPETTPAKPPVQQTKPPAKETTPATDVSTDVATNEITTDTSIVDETKSPETKGENSTQTSYDTDNEIKGGDINGKNNDSIIIIIVAVVAVVGIGVVIFIKKKRSL